ncbi:MAG: DUF2318 domain-containing protein [Planctomycetota bacterium]|jgi:uncharacterized membrane protein|nr:DUF2318 domain-containing protein [Planctomycetota bacterium]
MLKYIVAVTDAAMPAAIFLGILSGFYAQRPEGGRKGWVRAAGMGFLVAAILVILKRNTGFVVREYYLLALFPPAILLDLALLLAAVFPLLGDPGECFARWGRRAAIGAVFLRLALFLPDPLLFPFDFAVGMESILNNAYAGKVFGYALAAAACVLAFLAVSGCFRRLPPLFLGILSAAAFATVLASDLLGTFQILLARGLMPRHRLLVALVIDMINNRVWFLVLPALVAAVGVGIVFHAHARVLPEPGENPAQTRKRRAAARRRRRAAVAAVVVLSLSLVSATVGAAIDGRKEEPLPPRPVTARDNAILLPIPEVDDGHLYRFLYASPDGTEIRFIVIRKNETAFGVGFDACDVCGPTGYFERGGQVICSLCDVVMNKSTIGFPGGCNPVPLPFRSADGFLRIGTDDLEAQAWRFKP